MVAFVVLVLEVNISMVVGVVSTLGGRGIILSGGNLFLDPSAVDSKVPLCNVRVGMGIH